MESTSCRCGASSSDPRPTPADEARCLVEVAWGDSAAGDACSGAASFDVYRDANAADAGTTLVTTGLVASPFLDVPPVSGNSMQGLGSTLEGNVLRVGPPSKRHLEEHEGRKLGAARELAEPTASIARALTQVASGGGTAAGVAPRLLRTPMDLVPDGVSIHGIVPGRDDGRAGGRDFPIEIAGVADDRLPLSAFLTALNGAPVFDDIEIGALDPQTDGLQFMVHVKARSELDLREAAVVAPLGGQASLARGDDGSWVPARLGDLLGSGDRLRLGRGCGSSRAPPR